MTSCRICEERLPAYLEGGLSAAETRDLERHLADCPHCRRALEDFRRTGALLAGLEEGEAPPWFTARVMNRIREEGLERKSLFRRLFYPLHIKLPIEALASLMVAVLAWYVYQEAPPEMKALAPAPGPTAPALLPGAPPPAVGEASRQTGPPAQKKEKRLVRQSGETVSKPDAGLPIPDSTAGQGNEAPRARPFSDEASAAKEKKTEPAPLTPREGLQELRMTKAAPAPAPPAAPAEMQPAPSAPAAPRPAASREAEQGLSDKLETGRAKGGPVKDQAPARARAMAVPRATVTLTLRVREIGPAAEAVRKLLQEVKAADIREEKRPGETIVFAEIAGSEAGNLYRRLRELGEIQTEAPQFEAGKTVWFTLVIQRETP